jgi:hypothetical protein
MNQNLGTLGTNEILTLSRDTCKSQFLCHIWTNISSFFFRWANSAEHSILQSCNRKRTKQLDRYHYIWSSPIEAACSQVYFLGLMYIIPIFIILYEKNIKEENNRNSSFLKWKVRDIQSCVSQRAKTMKSELRVRG